MGNGGVSFSGAAKGYLQPVVFVRWWWISATSADGYFVSCPALQGCYSQGDTCEEAIENI
jgi:hypothetical protein